MRRKLLTSLIGILVLSFGGLAIIFATNNHPALGLDLKGGISVTLQPVGKYDKTGLDLAVERIRERVDALGVAEPEILRQGDAIVVNLPGVKNQDEALKLVQVTGQVYLRPVLKCTTTPAATASTSTTAPGGVATTVPGASTTEGAVTEVTSAGSPTTAAGPATTVAAIATGSTAPAGPARHPFGVDSSTTIPATSVPPVTTVPGGTPTTVPGGAPTTVPGGTTTTTQVVSDPAQSQVLPVRDGTQCYVGPSGGSGTVFENDAQASIITGSGWGVTVTLKGGSGGEGVWNQLASECHSQATTCPSGQLAIELDGIIQSHPTMSESSYTGGVQITGSFSKGEAQDLARVLKSGSLPIRLTTQTIQNVSPSLGKDSLRAAVISGLVGILLVLLFMMLYYRILGLVVVAGVAVSGALIWSVVSLLSKTSGLALSLSGITGIIISVGVTVDSYVVFFERLKDEVRAGRSMRNGAQRGFAGAWHTILVADLVSLLGAVVLWYLTVGSVRNFAFFLGLSTLCDLGVAYFFTRPAVLLLARTNWMAKRKVMGIEATQTGAAA
jgi:preprotein translocase subunit SecD